MEVERRTRQVYKRVEAREMCEIKGGGEGRGGAARLPV